MCAVIIVALYHCVDIYCLHGYDAYNPCHICFSIGWHVLLPPIETMLQNDDMLATLTFICELILTGQIYGGRGVDYGPK